MDAFIHLTCFGLHERSKLMKIGFIGCGNMGSAMISGMLKKGLYKKDEIIVSNLTEEGSKRSKEKLGVVTTLDNREVVKSTKLVYYL